MSGWQRIPATEWAAWASIHGHVVRPIEWEILQEMDFTFVEATAGKSEAGASSKPVHPEATPALFDAIFS